ncbi:hypothetical protein ACVWXU_001745 [Streptomyces sp. TE33382]
MLRRRSLRVPRTACAPGIPFHLPTICGKRDRKRACRCRSTRPCAKDACSGTRWCRAWTSTRGSTEWFRRSRQWAALLHARRAGGPRPGRTADEGHRRRDRHQLPPAVGRVHGGSGRGEDPVVLARGAVVGRASPGRTHRRRHPGARSAARRLHGPDRLGRTHLAAARTGLGRGPDRVPGRHHRRRGHCPDRRNRPTPSPSPGRRPPPSGPPSGPGRRARSCRSRMGALLAPGGGGRCTDAHGGGRLS